MMRHFEHVDFPDAAACEQLRFDLLLCVAGQQERVRAETNAHHQRVVILCAAAHVVIVAGREERNVGLAECARFIADRKVPLRDIITHEYAWRDAEEAYQTFDLGKTGKCVLLFD